MRTLFSWVHLADLNDLEHRLGEWKLGTASPKAVILADLVRLAHQTVRPDAIAVTGDIRLDDDADYNGTSAFLQSIAAEFSLSSQHVFLVPGNHDVNLKVRDRNVDRLVRSMRDGQEALDDVLRAEQDRSLLERRFQSFLSCASAFGSGDKLFWSERRLVRGTSIRLIGFNTELLFAGTEDGKLRVGKEQLSLLAADKDELVIALSHHPFDPLYLADANPARIELDGRAHVHLVSASYLADVFPSGPDARCPITLGAGGRPRDGSPRNWTYHLGSIVESDNGNINVRIWPRQWSPRNGNFRLDVESVPEGQTYVDIPLIEKKRSDGTATTVYLPDGEPPAPPTPKKWQNEQHVPYIEKFEVDAMGALNLVNWSIAPEPGWNVVIGDNGSGKTTFLRALSYALVSSSTYSSRTWKDEGDRLPFDIRRVLRKGELRIWQRSDGSSSAENQPTFVISHDENVSARVGYERQDLGNLFNAGFGPFRRFTGGDEGYEKEILQFPRVFRHLSLFTERIAFYESVRWLKYLQHKALSNRSDEPMLRAVKSFVNNEHLLPNGVRLDEINPDDILFKDGNGVRVALEDLSDGFRSILSLSLELVRQLASHYERDHIFEPSSGVVAAPGIVLIDEVDAHLHPSWQRVIGPRLRSLFPRFQFIVTTHSPLVCQGAADGHGTVFRLPKPGTDETAKMLQGVELARILYGNVLDAYGTGAFGHVERSDEGTEMRKRLVALNLKELSVGLSSEEEQEQDKLRAYFPTGK